MTKTREAESRLLAFCAAQHEAFDASAWASFAAVSQMELAATARYLAGVDWFGHRPALARVADQITPLNFEELTRTVDFDAGFGVEAILHRKPTSRPRARSCGQLHWKQGNAAGFDQADL